MVNSSILEGRNVIASDAYTLGEIDGIEIDPNNWTVTHLRVSLTKDASKDLRFKKPFLGSVIVCIPISLIQAFGDVISLRIPFSEVASLKECS